MTDFAQCESDTNSGATRSAVFPGPERRTGTGGTFAGRVSVAIVGVGAVLLAVHALGIPTPPCPLRWSTGIPCPFCGLTHLARYLATGQVGLVARNDPAGLVLAAALGVAVVTQLVAIVKKTSGGPFFMTSRTVGFVVLAVLAAHWVTTIVTGGLLTA